MIEYEINYGLDACYESVKFEIETLGLNVFEELGRAIIRAELDVLFNKTMIEAYRKYIKDNNLSWDN